MVPGDNSRLSLLDTMVSQGAIDTATASRTSSYFGTCADEHALFIFILVFNFITYLFFCSSFNSLDSLRAPTPPIYW